MPGPKPAAETVSATGKESPAVLDPAALERVRAIQRTGAPSILGRVIRAYLDNAPTLVAGMEAANAAADPHALAEAAHSLKSSSANLGAKQLSALCMRLEEMGRSSAIGKASGLIEELKVEYVSVQDALTREVGNT